MSASRISNNVNEPSGIAKLRKFSEQNLSQPEPMNLDDFINIPTPGATGFPSPQPPVKQQSALSQTVAAAGDDKASRSLTSAIPIKSRKTQSSSQHFIPQSVPFPPQHKRTPAEFNYVTRHHRKTSIDERRVSYFHIWLISFCTFSTPCLACFFSVAMPVLLLTPATTATTASYHCQSLPVTALVLLLSRLCWVQHSSGQQWAAVGSKQWAAAGP
jgi:hypothetical protein